VKPGQKLCTLCRNKLLKIKQTDGSNVESSLNAQDEEVDNMGLNPDELFQLQKQSVIDELNSSLRDIGCSPMKLHALGEHSRSSYGKQKLQRIQENVKKNSNCSSS